VSRQTLNQICGFRERAFSVLQGLWKQKTFSTKKVRNLGKVFPIYSQRCGTSGKPEVLRSDGHGTLDFPRKRRVERGLFPVFWTLGTPHKQKLFTMAGARQTRLLHG
jgi:hypothetical protein